MSLETLQVLWFLLFGVVLIAYSVLDGFDLGAGILSLFEKDPKKRQIYMDAIAPVWDANEVWLLTAGGALFAAFPPVYAVTFSGFYLAFFLVLACLIFRAVSFELKHRMDSHRWQAFWDYAFGFSSLVVSILYGVAIGNLLQGVPVAKTDTGFEWRGDFFGLLRPFPILVGLITLAMFAAHASFYISIKAPEGMEIRASKLGNVFWMLWVVLFVLGTVVAFIVAPHLFASLPSNPLFYLFLVLLLASFVFIPVFAKNNRYFKAFLASSVAIASQIALAGISMFPRMVPSSLDLENQSLTIFNASSSRLTLFVMFVIVLIALPIVLAYTAFIFKVFRGRIREEESYS